MPIKGISEIIRLPRLGKIRLGVKKDAKGTAYPEPTDHFVCPDEVRKVFGEKPTELRIMFPTNDSTQWASQYLRFYSESRQLSCRGNGKTAMARANAGSPTAGETRFKEITCNPGACVSHREGRCRKIMNLQFMLPDCPGFGVYQLDTSSFHSIVNVNSSLELIRFICGRYAMIPLTLQLIEQEVQPEGQIKFARVLYLEPAYSLVETQKYAQTPPDQVLLLPAPDNEAPDDLFPEEVLGGTDARRQHLTMDKELVNLWQRAKSRVWRLSIRDSQIADWFRRNYRVDVRLSDFDLIEPPSQVTAESLEHFLKTLERHADQT